MTTNIYPFLKPYFWATLVSAVISALSSNNNNSILISVISLITSVICLYELYQMRTISDHLSRAFSYQIIGTIGALASLIIGLLALLANPITNMGFMVFTLIIALIFAIIGIIGSYHFYWGLDELIEQTATIIRLAASNGAFIWRLSRRSLSACCRWRRLHFSPLS